MSEPGRSSITAAFPLAATDLCRTCDLAGLEFERSDQLPEPVEHLGQQRAADAIHFAMEMTDGGYNVFVLGRHGSHRHGLALQLARERAARKEPPDDWCYVDNLADAERPRALRFPAGKGAEFRDDLHSLIEELRLAIPAAFEGDDYRSQLKAIEAATQAELEERHRGLEERAEREGIAILQTPTGFVLAPIIDGKIIDDEEFAKLTESRREKVQAAIRNLSSQLQAQIEQIPQLRKRHREQVRALNREVASHAVRVLIAELKEKFLGLPNVVAFLEEIQADIIEHAGQFREPETSPLPFVTQGLSPYLERYDVNLIVRNEAGESAPVIYESNPGYQNLIGKIEHRAEMGALVTDYRMIRAGALLRANGGYLVLDALRVLTRPFAWEALKQALFAGQVRIESPGETYGLVSTTTLRPESIPLDVKIFLVGERWLYYRLCELDSEFADLFKVAADMEDELPRNMDNDHAYALLVADRVRRSGLPAFDRHAIERVINQRAREARDAERLSLHMRSLNDLLAQASHWARKRGSDLLVEAQDVDRALEESRRRLNRVQLRIVDEIRRNSLLIDTSGSRTGQVNGLSVVELGEFRFGHPVRITATTRMGTGDFVDIEREVELGGAIHSKGVLILSSALSSRYAPHAPLSMHASLVFEQTYGGVEGDSASVAELCALLSSLADVAIQQNLAVTGSVNQYGRIQVVGGINEKVEGFFDVCVTRGLDGTHGVIIPRENVKHLMLRADIVQAVADGRFSVYAVQHTDEALSILTGMPAGDRNERGEFPEDSVNLKVEQQLLRYAEQRKEFAEKSEDGAHD